MAYECFYTLPRQIEDHRIIWREDKKLRDRIDLLCQKIDSIKQCDRHSLEIAIARYLFEQLRQHPDDKSLQLHWVAFLLKRCEKVAIAMNRLLPSGSHIDLSDLFNIGVELASDPINFFANFDESRYLPAYWYPTIKKFADSKIKHCLLPRVREIIGLKTFCQTNLGLASRSSRKQVRDALERSQVPEQNERYLLVWHCFQEVKNSVRLPVNNFRSEHFQQIADRYNQLQDSDRVGTETIKAWLETIGAAIRQLLDPPVLSFDCSFDEERTSIVEPDCDWELDRNAIALKEFVDALLQQLEKIQEKQILLLRYGLNLTQTEIASELNKNQSTINRKLAAMKEVILTQVLDWAIQNLGIKPCSEGLDGIDSVLMQYYSDLVDRFSVRALQILGDRSLNLLRLCYVAGETRSSIAKQLSKSEIEIDALLEAIKQWLSFHVIAAIESEIQIELQERGAARAIVPVMTEHQLQTILQLQIP